MLMAVAKVRMFMVLLLPLPPMLLPLPPKLVLVSAKAAVAADDYDLSSQLPRDWEYTGISSKSKIYIGC
jgi:hypothetical protein